MSELEMMFDLGLVAGLLISVFLLCLAIVALMIQARIDSKKKEDGDE